MTDKNLASLKVYGNDDPAGSVYKVSGGSGADDLVLYIDTDSTSTGNPPLWHLVTASGESVTYQDLQNAITQGRQVCLVYIADGGGGSAEYIDRLSMLATHRIPSVPFMAIFSGVRIRSLDDPDPTMNVTPFGANEETEPLRWPLDGGK